MDENGQKFCNFRLYCPKCAHYEVPQEEEPCNECLGCPTNTHSEKPVNYKPKEVK